MPATGVAERLRVGPRGLPGELVHPLQASGLVLLFHARPDGRSRQRNRKLAAVLHDYGLATLQVGLAGEHDSEPQAEALRLDPVLMAPRMLEAVNWARQQPGLSALRMALIGSCMAGAAVLLAAVRGSPAVGAIVSLSGHLDLVAGAGPEVRAPVLLIVGGADQRALQANRDMLAALHVRKRLETVPAAGHRFEEPGALDTVAHAVADWLRLHLADTP